MVDQETCFECGRTIELQNHHVVPRSRGGTKKVQLCLRCHGKCHHRKNNMSGSQLTKDGLKKAKENGVKLGNPRNLTTTAREAGNAGNIDASERHRAKVLPIAIRLRKSGHTLAKIGQILTGNNILTRYGNPWSPTAVLRLLNR